MRNERGIISMITTIMVSIMLITIALGLIILLSGTLQQSSDDELSLRAYAAAEGGIEWAVSQLNPSIPGYVSGVTFLNCNGPGSAPVWAAGHVGSQTMWPNLYTFGQPTPADSFQNVITCLRITNQSNQVTGTLGPNDSNQVELAPSGQQLQQIKISWIGPTEMSPSQTPQVGPAGINAATITAAAMEITVVHFVGGVVGNPNVNPHAIGIRNIIFLPNKVGGGGQTGTEPTITAAACTGATYQCSVTINAGVAAGETTIVSIRGRYLSSSISQVSYQLQLLDTIGNPIPVPDQNATIDVTARAGSVYRRVIAQVPVNQGVPGNINYVLFGDQNVCKAFNFYQNNPGSYAFGPSSPFPGCSNP